MADDVLMVRRTYHLTHCMRCQAIVLNVTAAMNEDAQFASLSSEQVNRILRDETFEIASEECPDFPKDDGDGTRN